MTTKRPRRLLLVAAVIALAVGMSPTAGEPLRAQTSAPEPVVTFQISGVRPQPRVTGTQIKENGTRQTFVTGEGDDEREITPRGVTLAELAALAGPGLETVTVFGLMGDRNAAPQLYATRDSRLFFYVVGGQVRWLEYDDNRHVVARGSGMSLWIAGSEGRLLTVEATADPAEGLRAGDTVALSVEEPDWPEGEELERIRWFDGDGEIVGRRAEIRERLDDEGAATFTVDVHGTAGSRALAVVTLDVDEAEEETDDTGGPGSGSDGGGDPGGGDPGGGDPGGGLTPGPSPPIDPLPPPSSSPPPADVPPSGGPNLDPSAPDGSSDLGEEVEGILVSASVPPSQAGQQGGGAQPTPTSEQAREQDDGVDWKLAGGIAVTCLLVILGALREARARPAALAGAALRLLPTRR